MNTLRVAHVQTTSGGGAGIAALRLHEALLAAAVSESTNVLESDIFFAHTAAPLTTAGAHIVRGAHNPLSVSDVFGAAFTKNTYADNTMFGSNYPSLSFGDLAFLQHYDVINLHWVQYMLSAEAIAHLSHQDAPLVWTAHDRNFLTGGCHYFHGCDGWKRDCSACPQLKNTWNDFPKEMLAFKKAHWNIDNMAVVALNPGLAAMYKKSPIFKDACIKVIYNSLDMASFCPSPPSRRAALRAKLKLPQHKKILLYASNYKSTIKGYKEFVQMVGALTNKQDFHVVLLGSIGNEVKESGVSYTHCGAVPGTTMPQYYNAADVTVLPSFEESLPNVMTESIACGTPVAGFAIDPLRVFIKNGVTGALVPVGDPVQLARAVESLAAMDAQKIDAMKRNCRAIAEKHLTPSVQVCAYTALYEDVAARARKKSAATRAANRKIAHSLPEYNPKTAAVAIDLMRAALEEARNNAWYRFGTRSVAGKLRAVLVYVLRKIRLYAVARFLFNKLRRAR